MAFGYIVVAILAAAIAVFALQNNTPTPVRFAIWSIESVSVAALILIALAAGLIVAGVPLLIQRWRLRSRARALEARIAALETVLAERRASLTSSPPPRSAAE
jgi:uncharacterized integral membrane protein